MMESRHGQHAILYAALPVTLSLLSLIGCDHGRGRDHVTIGIALDARNRRGVELAVREINRAGGIDGVQLAVEGAYWTDPGFSNPNAIIEWAERLTERRDILGVIGHSDSTGTLAGAGLYNERGLPHIVTIATHPEITRIGPWTYRVCLDDRAQGRLLARYVVETWGKSRIAVFYVNDDYGRGLAEQFQLAVERSGGEIVASVFHADTIAEDDEEVIAALLDDWVAADRPDVVALLDRPDAARRIVELMRERTSQIDIVGGDNLALMLQWESERERMNGVRAAAFFVPDESDPEVLRLLREFGDDWHLSMDYSAAFAYDAVHLLADAIERGGFSRRGVRSALEEMVRSGEVRRGVAGPYLLGADRNARRELHIVELRDGTVRPVARFSADSAELETDEGARAPEALR